MIGKRTGCAVVLAMVGACAPADTSDTSDMLLLVRGPAEVAGTGPVWCYSTLADPDCYIERDLAASHRLIGAYVLPPPSDPSQSEQSPDDSQ